MADYYPLIARAVAGLEKNTGDARRALYERARTALVAQLRSVNPPLSENDVTRERLALEESIRKVEAEAARKTLGRSGQRRGADARSRARIPALGSAAAPAAPDDDEPSPRAAAEPQPRHAASRSRAMQRRHGRAARRRRARCAVAAAAGAGRRRRAAANGMLGGERYVDPVFDQPLPSEQAPNMPPRRRPRVAPKQRSPLAAGLRAEEFPRRRFRERRRQRSAAARREERPARENGAALPSSHDFDRIDARSYDPHGAPLSDYPAPPMLEQGPDYDEPRPLPAKARPGRSGHGARLAPVVRRHRQDRAHAADPAGSRRRHRLAMAEHDVALPIRPHARRRDPGRATIRSRPRARTKVPDRLEPERRRARRRDAVAASARRRAVAGACRDRRHRGAEGRALRGRPDRSAGQAFRRLGDLAHRAGRRRARASRKRSRSAPTSRSPTAS